jgi:hypothetical protein
MKGAVLLAVLAVGGALWHFVACALFPFANCKRCGGSGKTRSKSGRHFRACRRCKGTGRRLRIGRRVWNWLRRARDAAK